MDKELKSLFEAGRLNELEEKLKGVDPETLSPDDILDYMAFRALIDEKLYGVYWSEDHDRLAGITMRKAAPGMEYIRVVANYYRTKAEFLFRNFQDSNLGSVRYLLNMSCFFFDEVGDEFEVLITYSKLIRVRFAFVLQDISMSEKVGESIILDIHSEYLGAHEGSY